MRISILNLSFITLLALNSCKSSADEQINIVSINDEITAQDQKVLDELRHDISILLDKEIAYNAEAIRNTPLRFTVSFDLPRDIISISELNTINDKVKSNFNGWLLGDNKKGARIYCLSDKKTFELHEPFSIGEIAYDMNDHSENRGIYKLVQLNDKWNIRIYYYKKGNGFCNR